MVAYPKSSFLQSPPFFSLSTRPYTLVGSKRGDYLTTPHLVAFPMLIVFLAPFLTHSPLASHILVDGVLNQTHALSTAWTTKQTSRYSSSGFWGFLAAHWEAPLKVLVQTALPQKKFSLSFITSFPSPNHYFSLILYLYTQEGNVFFFYFITHLLESSPSSYITYAFVDMLSAFFRPLFDGQREEQDRWGSSTPTHPPTTLIIRLRVSLFLFTTHRCAQTQFLTPQGANLVWMSIGGWLYQSFVSLG